MKNHMKDVAELLGVELDEEFEIVSAASNIYKYFAKITIDGMEVRDENGISYGKPTSDSFLAQMLSGSKMYDIKLLPYKPKYGESYWFVRRNGFIEENDWRDYSVDLIFRKIGNCYRSEEDAFKHIEKWVKFYNSDELLDVE